MADDLRVKLILEVVDRISSPMAKVSSTISGATAGISASLKKATRAVAEFGAGLKEGAAKGLADITAKTRVATAATDKLALSAARAKAATLRGGVSSEVRDRMDALAARAGVTGTALAGMGAAGLVAGAGIGAIAVGAGAAFLGLRKVISVTDAAIEQFAALSDQAIQLGMSGDQFQELDFAAAQVGVKTEQAVVAFTKLNDALGQVMTKGKDAPKELADTFKALGVRGRDIVAAGGDINVLLPKIADGFKNLKTHSERVTFANNLFGARAGAKFLQMFEGGAAGLKELARLAHSTGSVLERELFAKIVAADARLDVLGKASRAATGVIGASFAGASATLTEFRVRTEQAFAAWVLKSGIGDKVEAALQKMGIAFDAWLTRLGGADAVFDTLATAAGTSFGLIGDAVEGAIKLFVEVADWINRVKAALEEPVSMTGILGIFGLKFEMPAWMSQLLNWTSQVKAALGGAVSVPVPPPLIGPPPPMSPAPKMPPPQLLPQRPPLSMPRAAQIPSPGEDAQLGTAGRPRQTIPWVNRNIPPPTTSAPAAPSAAPPLAPARPTARPGTEDKHSSLDWSGVIDLNVRGPASVARTRTRGPGPISIRPNQGLNMGVG